MLCTEQHFTSGSVYSRKTLRNGVFLAVFYGNEAQDLLADANPLDVGKAALGIINCLSLSSELTGFNHCVCKALPSPPEIPSREK